MFRRVDNAKRKRRWLGSLHVEEGCCLVRPTPPTAAWASFRAGHSPSGLGHWPPSTPNARFLVQFPRSHATWRVLGTADEPRLASGEPMGRHVGVEDAHPSRFPGAGDSDQWLGSSSSYKAPSLDRRRCLDDRPRTRRAGDEDARPGASRGFERDRHLFRSVSGEREGQEGEGGWGVWPALCPPRASRLFSASQTVGSPSQRLAVPAATVLT